MTALNSNVKAQHVRTFRDQTLASTNLDRQGERLSKHFLERCCARMSDARFPVHQGHDMRKPVSGHIENPRLVPDTDHPGEWCLIGDVYINEGTLEEVLGGFSISGTEIIRRPEDPTALLYLPFPHYNDEDLLTQALSDVALSVGKWIKKGAEPLSWALLGSVVAFAITPIWEDVYKRKIAPRIDELITRLLPLLSKKGLATELVQIVIFKQAEVEVRIIPVQGKEEICLHSSVVEQGLRKVVAFLTTDTNAQAVGVKRIVIFFDEGLGTYKLHRIEYADGRVEHVA